MNAPERAAPPARGEEMSHPFKSRSGLARIAAAARHSTRGLAAAWCHEHAFRQELLLAVVLVPVALMLNVSALGKAVMIGAVMLVLITELLNSAIETVVDRISVERHELSGRAKDIGSAAVLLSLVNAAVVWLLVLLG